MSADADADETDSRERRPTPPRTVTDGESRGIRLRVADGDRAALAAMYDDFGAADRAVGHGVLLAGGPGHELALFVRPDYRRAGVGTALLRTLLGRGRVAGVERGWLSVRRTL